MDVTPAEPQQQPLTPLHFRKISRLKSGPAHTSLLEKIAPATHIHNSYIPHVSKPLIIGIAGGSGSGKSTVARKVADALTSLSVAFIDMDAYYRNFTKLSLDERRRVNWDHPDAFDFDLLTAHLKELASRQTIEKPVYDFVTHLRSSDTVTVEPSDVIVIDGILLFVDPRVRELCDVKVFVDADADIRLIRRLRRDMRARGRPLNEIIDQYLSTVQPMHLQFVEPSKRYADIIVPRGGHNAIAIEMIVAKITRRLAAAMA
jgi:uridine kinase